MSKAWTGTSRILSFSVIIMLPLCSQAGWMELFGFGTSPTAPATRIENTPISEPSKLKCRASLKSSRKLALPDGKLNSVPGEAGALAQLQVMVAAALEASDAILALYESDQLNVTRKTDHSPVTAADLEANRIITARLNESIQGIPVISEESPLPPYQDRRKWQSYFIIDPIDGTKDFIDRTGEFTVNIALIRDRLPEMGVVVAPAKGVIYFAAKGIGTWKQVAGSPPQRVQVNPSREPRILVSSNHLNTLAYNDFFHARGIERTQVAALGSSLKFALVADGSATSYVRLKGQKEWDVAAGFALYRFAGVDGSENPMPFLFNSETLKTPPFHVGLLP